MGSVGVQVTYSLSEWWKDIFARVFFLRLRMVMCLHTMQQQEITLCAVDQGTVQKPAKCCRTREQ